MLKYINIKNMFREIEMYGYSYSLPRHLLLVLLVVAGEISFAQILGLKEWQIVILIVLVVLLLPRLVLNTYINMFEQKKFIDVSNYMEQMLYSFKRKSKITTALEESQILFPDGLMGDRIGKALHYIEFSFSEGDIYKEALAIIEEVYDCDIIRRVHEFMISVEKTGGEYEMSIDILISDRNKWVARTAMARKEIQLVKRNVTIAIGLSLLIITGTVLMVPVELVDIKTNIISQLSSMVTIIVNFLLWFYVQCKFSNSWIQMNSTISEHDAERYYNKVMIKNREKKLVNCIKLIIIGVFTTYVGCVTQNVIYICICILLGIVFMTQSKRSFKMYKKKLRREVEKVFPDWLLGLSLRMQTENVQVAISQSIIDAPFVMRKELQIMENKLESQPTAIVPYLEFYRELEIPEVQSAMRMLYSLGQNGTEEMVRQIQMLVQRNSEMQDQGEKKKVEDYLSGIGFCVLLPMLFGCGKMMVDMVILMLGILTAAQGFY